MKGGCVFFKIFNLMNLSFLLYCFMSLILVFLWICVCIDYVSGCWLILELVFVVIKGLCLKVVSCVIVCGCLDNLVVVLI